MERISILISVIIPVYGVEKYIERCAQSLFEQTIESGIEYIFVDDCTPDDSISVLEKTIEKYPQRIPQVRIVHHKENLGLSAARLTGLSIARGKYIAHCDSDDWCESHMYKALYDVGAQDDADMVVCDYYTNTDTKQTYVTQSVCCDTFGIVNQVLRGEIHNGLWNKLIRRKIYEKLSPTFVQGINMWEDVSVLPRLAYYSHRISYIPEPMYHYYQANVNAYTQAWKPIYAQNIIDTIILNNTFFKDKGVGVTALWTRGFYTILWHTHGEERKQHLEFFFQNNPKVSIDYSIFSLYGKIVCWALFNKYNLIADSLIFTKAVICKFR